MPPLPESGDKPEYIDPGPERYVRACDHCGQVLQPMRIERPNRAMYIPRSCDCSPAKAEREAARLAQLEADRQQEIAQLLYASGLNSRHYQKFTFDRWDTGRNGESSAEALENVLSYAAEVQKTGQNWMWLSGQYGLGKTHLAVAAVRKLAVDRLWKPRVIVWPELCQQTQESWSSDSGDSEGIMWSRARSAEILLIDDLDKTSTGEWAMGKLFGLVNHRYERELPTIITANRGIGELKRLWQGSKKPHVADTGMAVLSRIMGQLWAMVEFKGNDQRMA